MTTATAMPMIGELFPLILRVEFLRRIQAAVPSARRSILKRFARALVSGRS